MSYPSTEEIMWYKQALKSRQHSAEQKKLATRPLHTLAVTQGTGYSMWLWQLTSAGKS